MTKLPKTVPIPAPFFNLTKLIKKSFFIINKKKHKVNKLLPAPATPTVAAPAPMYLAAESISLRTTLV